jgi:NAD(P)-dependent dehydrogenase (short-subunit alcohol dehydrogenase family)
VRLEGKVAVVTGAAQGIGRGIAHRFAEEGARVVVADVQQEKGEQTVAELQAKGAEAVFVATDVTVGEQLRAAIDGAAERFGRLDVLVNNAGVGIGEAMHELTSKYVDLQLGVNLRAVILMTRECLPMLREAGSEHGKALILNMASISGKAGQAWLSVYSATKAAVIGFSQATQRECANDGIQVTAFAPAFVDTDMTEFARGAVDKEAMIRPEDIAEAARLLLRTSPNCVIPEISFLRPGDTEQSPAP